MTLILRFFRDETAGSAVEYGLIAGMVACVIINALQNLGPRLSTKFMSVRNALS